MGGEFQAQADAAGPIQRRLSAQEKAIVRRCCLAQGIAEPTTIDHALEKTWLIAGLPTWRKARGPRATIAAIALDQRARGIALREKIYVHRELFSPQATIPMDLLVHECSHVVQFFRDGVGTFLLRYLLEYSQGRARGLDDHAAYLAISYEIEARQTARFEREFAEPS